MRAVIDASVAVKWVFPDPLVEPHADQALEVLDAVRQGRIDVIQPVHWLLETTAVVVRLNPDILERAFGLLDALELQVCDEHTWSVRSVYSMRWSFRSAMSIRCCCARRGSPRTWTITSSTRSTTPLRWNVRPRSLPPTSAMRARPVPGGGSHASGTSSWSLGATELCNALARPRRMGLACASWRSDYSPVSWSLVAKLQLRDEENTVRRSRYPADRRVRRRASCAGPAAPASGCRRTGARAERRGCPRAAGRGYGPGCRGSEDTAGCRAR